jgi:hypothetical protein
MSSIKEKQEECKEILTTGATLIETKAPIVEPSPIRVKTTAPDRIERLEQRKALGTGLKGRELQWIFRRRSLSGG